MLVMEAGVTDLRDDVLHFSIRVGIVLRRGLCSRNIELITNDLRRHDLEANGAIERRAIPSQYQYRMIGQILRQLKIID